jgi:hypothetical protein
MRARDYDAKTGLFLSRDAVDVQEQGVEAFNPYQFAYSNTLIHSDPTGLFSISEANAANAISDILTAGRAQATNHIRQELIDQAKGIAGDVVKQLIKTIVPFNFEMFYNPQTGNHGNILDNLFQFVVCDVIGNNYSPFLDKLWLEPGISKGGDPVTNGYGCGPQPVYYPRQNLNPNTSSPTGTIHPDFIFRNVAPLDIAKNPQGFLIGDLKYSVNSIKPSSDGQLNGILAYAKAKGVGKGSISPVIRQKGGHQFLPIAIYLTVEAVNSAKENAIKERALAYGVVFETISFR